MRLTSLPVGEKTSSLYQVKVNGTPVSLMLVRVSAMPLNCFWPGHQRDLSQTEEAAVLSFSMTQPVELEVTADRDFASCLLRPLSAGICPQSEGRSIRFTLAQPGQYALELDGLHAPLMIFADPEKDFGVSEGDPGVIWYGPGVHDAGHIELTDGQTLYIDRDAVVYGWVRAIGARNIRILGCGVLDNSREERTNTSTLVAHDIYRRNTEFDVLSPQLMGVRCDVPTYPIQGTDVLADREAFLELFDRWNVVNSPIQLYGCENAQVMGLTIRDSVGFSVIGANCTDLLCENVKIVGMWRYNSDGIDLINSSRCVIRDCFVRAFDDCIVLKGIPGWDTRNVEDILVEGCVVWNDWGRALEIGAETCADQYQRILYRDCDILHAVHCAMDIQSCDRAHVHDVTYQDIRVEYSLCDPAPQVQQNDEEGFRFVHGEPDLLCCTFVGEMYCSNARQKGRITNITCKDIQVFTDIPSFQPRIRLDPDTEERPVRDITVGRITVR